MGQQRDASFEQFFAATYSRLIGLLFAFLHDRAQAEDVVQDAFASALLRWRTLRGYHDPEAWVRTVAFRRAIDHHRRNARRLRALLRLGPPPPLPPVGADHVDLVRALRRLPLAQREVLVLHHVAELAVEQVAAELGVSVGTVKSRLARGRAALADHLRLDVEAHNEESTNA
ncbi:MAG TPA: SigE family RNA polymerase sigma factor [Actinomycetota bacterium]